MFAEYLIGAQVYLNTNSPNYASNPLPLIFAVESMASSLLMAVILAGVYTKDLRGLGGIAIGGIVVLDIFLFNIYMMRFHESYSSIVPSLLSVSWKIYGFFIATTFAEQI